MLNAIFILLIVLSVAVAGFTGHMADVNQAGIDAAGKAVEIAIGLIGMMALWLGFMRVLRDAGAMQSIARAVAPVMRRLFPEIPADHPAMGAMIMNIAANMLGLGNAATPFGLKAMRELNELNTRKGVATDSMALFLAINTSGVAVLPLGAIAIRDSLGSGNAAGILIPTLLATMCSTIAGVTMAKWLARRAAYAPERYAAAAAAEPVGPSLADGIAGMASAEETAGIRGEPSRAHRGLALAAFAVLAVALGRELMVGDPAGLRAVLNSWLLPLLMAGIVLFAYGRRVEVYDSFIQGAREGFQIAVMIIPFLVAILVAVAMFRASGSLDALIALVSPITSPLGFPAEALPMALIRPLSGSGAMAVMTETMQTYGPDSFVGYLVSTMNGSTETTFYVIALYLGSVGVRSGRHAIAACLTADAVGVVAALIACRVFFG